VTNSLRAIHSSVNQVVQLYRDKRRRRERMVIVLLTDESGDDGMAVEPTVLNCRQHGVAVHVIGPTAVMGLEEGAQLWTSHATGQPLRFLLKVKRGPETCLPERAFLPYWHELDRCRAKNESTPWSDLAGWEVASDFGIRILTKEIPLPPPKVHQGFSPSQMGLKSTNMMGGGGGSLSFPSL
jgi:hypothetical protein